MRTALAGALVIALSISPAAPQSTSPNAPGVAPGTPLNPEQFVRTSGSHQWRASKLIGLDVYGTENEKIGEVVELLIDIAGNEVVVLGVGGFLGIARREVAVPFKAVDWRYGDPPRSRDADASRPAPAETGADRSGRRTIDNTRRGYPDFAFVGASKDSLKAAPEFKYASEEPRTTSTPQPR
jgi:sporulation protein YlmC with PRC-barrel domain